MGGQCTFVIGLCNTVAQHPKCVAQCPIGIVQCPTFVCKLHGYTVYFVIGFIGFLIDIINEREEYD